MAQLPPDGNYLIQQVGTEVILFERGTNEDLVRYPVGDANATAKAQKTISELPELSIEQRAFAHFWSGYFYGCHHGK